ncbi:hypothetical protein K474DRAFT_362074 [Panus rudis PR-1116 ss-1]|nr:hypothetical protein K474DRAFT_362074 [Panus rudis PR-1116 ss-1]
MKFLTKLTPLAILPYLSLVSAHGRVGQVSIDGKMYKGNPVGNEKFPSIIRLIQDNGPIKDANSPDLACGPKATNAKLVADVNPGSKMTFYWWGGYDGNSPWPHNVGPIMTYMAECTGTTCDKFDASKAKWFKIHQLGKKDATGWYQDDLHQNKPLIIPIPENLKAGNYLVRTEILALHTAQSLGGAEFYPSCTQVRVGGSGTGTPSSTVSFPGAYKATEPGILVDEPDLKTPYVFPGPPVDKLASSGGSNATNSNSNSSASASGNDKEGSASASISASSTVLGLASPSASALSRNPSQTASASGSASSFQCSAGMGKRYTFDKAAKRRHISRIMARMMH